MLNDLKPVTVEGVEGVLVYADETDPATFHYAATVPSLSRVGGEPAFSLLRFEPGSDDSAGQLSMVVDLAVSEVKLETLKSVLGRQAGTAVTMLPIPWTSGSFSAAIAVPGSAPIAGQPSLVGDNAAVISLALDRAAFVMLQNALDRGDISPLSIVYKLCFDSFSPAFHCTVEIDSDNFRNWVQKRCSANFILIDFESVDTYVSLRKADVFRITVVDFDPDSDGAFQRSLLSSLRPLFQPLPHFGETAGQQGGSGIGFSCSQITGTDFASRRGRLRFDEVKAMPRAVYLQGTVAGVAEAYRAKGVASVPTRGGAVFRQSLVVNCYADYAADGIDHVAVAIRRKGQPELVGRHDFSAANPGPWTLDVTRDPRDGVVFERQASVFFDGARGGRPLVSDWERIEQADVFVSVTPRDLYTLRTLPVFAGKTFPWRLVQDITVKVTPPEGSGAVPVRISLTEGKPSGSIELFMAPPVTDEAVTFTASILLKSGLVVELDRRPAASQILIDPFQPRDVTFSAEGLDWSRMSKVLVGVTVPDGVVPDGPRQLTLTRASPKATLRCLRLPAASQELTVRVRFTPTDAPPAQRTLTTKDRIVSLSYP